MPEPVNRWEPITDLYKEEALKAPDIETANEQIRQELNEEKAKQFVPEKKAPLGIRIFIWYLFGRAGFYALLLLILASFPHSDFSNWMFDTAGNLLHLPGSKGEVTKRRKAIQDMYASHGYQVPNQVLDEVEGPPPSDETMHNEVMVGLLLLTGLSALIGFLWWIRWWYVRWIAMCYAGGMAIRALIAITLTANVTSDIVSQIRAAVMPLLVVSIAINAFICLYLAFGYGVKEWFEEG